MHENKQLQLDVDQEGAQYISARSSLPGTPGLAEGVFAKEQQVKTYEAPIFAELANLTAVWELVG